ncbi:uncharacterized protein EDB91DRAFT_1253499 [Suillus paluster]|uniref:uncharacterized protein n=1 Tax=Suillus paluster TaxID=48578 RepID=UPI001B861D4F|nr:uncharacterized protein EDB91DRAFT_1253499 [Suillus paluster]KAG1728398.1 hypothetical protein EDB91DRAFT_1253499 [Suillus paluster]
MHYHPPPRHDIHALLQHEPVASVLGTEIQREGTGFADLELRQYLTSYAMLQEQLFEPSIWHLVDSVRIYGAFDVLASGAIALVDIPDFGDANKKGSTKRTNEYIKNIEVVVLGSNGKVNSFVSPLVILSVADIRRAADDQATREYFEKL